MMRNLKPRAILTLALAGVVLRALIPIGYMPAPLGSGLLFVLCPDQVPGIERLTSHAHHDAHGGHHGHGAHHNHAAGEPHAADSCDFGHIVASDVIVDAAIDIESDALPAPAGAGALPPARAARSLLRHHARAPPA